MALLPEQLQIFTELYNKEYGVVLSEEQAILEFSKLSELYKIVYQKKPDSRNITAL